MKTLVLVNTLTNVNPFVYSNHCQFWARTIRENPNDDFLLMTPNRMSIDMARNLAAKQALILNFDYLMFIDDDVLLPFNTFKMLKDADKDVVAGLGCIRGFPFDVMAFKATYREEVAKNPHGDPILVDGKEQTLIHKELRNYNDLPKEHKRHMDGDYECLECKKPEHQGLVELVPCGAIGFSCCLIKMDVLRGLSTPYFVTLPNCTEDVYFCNRIQEELTPEPEIFLHTGVQWGHMLNAEPIEYRTIKKFQDFYSEENLDKFARAEEAKGERDLPYITKVLAKMS